MNARIGLLASLVLPIVALAGNTLLHHWQRGSGQEIVLPIEGFDPRDLLSGHYLTYRVNYGVDGQCSTTANSEASVCLQPDKKLYTPQAVPASCQLFIRGICDSGGLFRVPSVERFYIPEQYAVALDQKVRNRQGSLVLSVDSRGNASIRDLLIDGKPWKSAMETSP